MVRVTRILLTACLLCPAGLLRAEDPAKPANPPKPEPAQPLRSTSDLPAIRLPTPAGQPQSDRPTRAPGTEPSSEQVAGWLRDLKSPDFDVREKATDELVQAGVAAVPGLLEVAQTARLEPAIRSVRILRKLYEAGTFEDFEAAADALEELALGQSGIAQRAELALSSRAIERQQRVISRIEDLGGEVRLSTRQLPAVMINGTILQENIPQVEALLLGEDWKGGDDGLKLIRRLQPTVHITVYVTPGSGIAQNSLDTLMADRPDIEVQHRGSAMLGISCETIDGQLLVGKVQEGSGAEAAGIKVNDLIVKFEGKEITDFQVIIEAIRQRKVGDTLTLEVSRPGMDMITSKAVTLGKWTLKDLKK